MKHALEEVVMRPTRSSSIVAVLVTALAFSGLAAAAGAARAHGRPPSDGSAVSVRIWPLARATPDGGLTFRVFVRCGPLDGTPDFRQAFAGASQARSGAGGEGGLSPDVVCDGVQRVYTATVSSTTGSPFRRGLADVSATVNACNAVGDGQVCVNGSAGKRVFVWTSRRD
jgi:hypothetical protein